MSAGILRRRMPVAPARGVTLIELMVSLVIGLLVTGAALTLVMTNRQTYVATESLGRVQEHARTAFELMARDLRESAGNACGNDLSMTNVVNDDGSNWYVAWSDGLHGYDATTAMPGLAFGTGTGSRVSGTQALELHAFVNDGVQIKDHIANSAVFHLSTADHDLDDGDIAMACDPGHAAIFQVTNASPGTNGTVVHETGHVLPGNCTKSLGDPTPTASSCADKQEYTFGCKLGLANPGGSCKDGVWPAFVAKLHATRWYIGNASDGGHALFRSDVRNDKGKLQAVNSPVTEGVDDMQLAYLVDKGASYAAAAPGTDWSKVSAIRITLVLTAQDKVGGKALQRTLEHVVALRNRAP